MAAAAVAAPIRIGLLLPPSEIEAEAILHGAELAVEAVNREPGAKVALVVRGQAGQWGADGNEAVVLVSDEGVQAILAPTTGATTHQALQVAGRTRVPVVSLCPDSSITAAGIPWAVRIAPRTDEEAAALFGVVTKSDRVVRVAAFVPHERAGREAAKDLRAAARGLNLEWAEPIAVPPHANPTAWIPSALATRPDVVLLWLEPAETGHFAKGLRAAGFSGRLASHSRVFTATFLSAAGEAAEGLLAATVPFATRSKPARDEFLQDYARRFCPPTGGQSPLRSPTAAWTGFFTPALASDAVRLLADVLRRAGDQPGFREFPLTRTLPGVTGELAFDSMGNRRVRLQVLEWHAGAVHILSGETTQP